MSRMDVKTKIQLMNVFESYWDMLPPEVQDQILAYKRSQERIDEEKKDKMRDLCMEIMEYGELKRKWGLGHVKCTVKKEICLSSYKYHLRIVGEVQTERSEVCTHDRGQDSPIQTDLARLIRCLLYGKTRTIQFV